MALKDLLESTQKLYKKKCGKDNTLPLKFASQMAPPTGLVVDNPLLEFVLDRRFIPYGRCYLTYGKKGCSKTSLALNLIKLFQQAGGDAIWVETEKAADLDYAAKQGVDLDRLVMPEVDTLQEALTTCEGLIHGLAKAYPEGDTPVIIVLDSIAGALPEYETQENIVVGQTKVGEHARLMAGFYRNIIHPLAHEKAIFVALNQLRDAIGQMSFGTEKPEALIGGEAQRFHSTYQWKMVRTSDLVKKNPNAEGGAERKIGSRHKMTCKRNKLGREGNTQVIEFDLYERGGIDWWSPLVRKVASEYNNLIRKSGGFYYWEIPDTIHKIEDVEELDDQGNLVVKQVAQIISTEKAYREGELGMVIKASTQAKELIRKAFGIPDLPAPEVIAEVENDNKKKRGKKSKNNDDDGDNVVVDMESL